MGNVERDRAAIEALQGDGWRVLVIWECALRGPNRRDCADVIEQSERFIGRSRAPLLVVQGTG